jgi:hypothetical protein
MMFRLLPLLLIAGLAASAGAQTADQAAPTDPKAPETRNCLSNRDIRAREMSAEAGYFARTPQGWWRNTGPACSVYAPNRALLTRSIQDRQCRADIVVVFDAFSRIEYGACVLGDWVRVDAPPEALFRLHLACKMLEMMNADTDYTRASMASQIRAGVSVPLKRSIATIPVGEVTLISVK